MPTPPQYAFTQVWEKDLGPGGEAFSLAVCPDGRSYLLVQPQRLVVLSPDGETLYDELVPSLQGAISAACGPDDLLYAAGSDLVKLQWSQSQGIITEVSDTHLPLLAWHIAVSSTGDVMLRGVSFPNAIPSTYILLNGSSPELVPTGQSQPSARSLFESSLVFDVKGNRFVALPWNDYTFRAWDVDGKFLRSVSRQDATFHPVPVSDQGPPSLLGGDLVPGLVALPDGDFITTVGKRYTGPAGTIHNTGGYLEILDASFHVLATQITMPPYGGPEAADSSGNLYFITGGPNTDMAVVKAHFAAQ